MTAPGRARRIAAHLWGFDFFISYHWASGGRYAVALAEALRARGFECFLDRSEFAAGDDWKSEARLALRRTQRLLVIATIEAVTSSAAVAHELEVFQSRNKPVILVAFGRRFAEHERAEHAALQLISGDLLDIVETADALHGKPSVSVIDELVRSYNVVRRRALRARWITAVICTLTALLIVSAYQTKRAVDQRDEADRQRRHAEDASIGQAGDLLVAKAHNGDDDGLLPAAVDLAERALAAGRPPPSAVTRALAAAVSRSAYRVKVLQGRGAQAYHPVFAQPGRVVLSTLEGPPRLYEDRTGAEIATLGKHPADAAVALNGERIVTYAGDADVWDARTGTLLMHLEPKPGLIRNAVFSPSGERVALVYDNKIEVFAVGNGAIVNTLARDAAPISHVNGRLATLTGEATLSLWDLDTASAVREIEIGSRPKAIVLSPRAGYVAAIRGDTCELWSLSTKARIGSFSILSIDGQPNVVFSSDETVLFSAFAGKLQVHASATAQLVHEAEQSVSHLLAVPDTSFVLTSPLLGETRIREPSAMRVLFTAPEPMGDGEFSRDGRWLLSVGKDLVARVWDVPAQRMVASLRGTDLLLDAAMSADGSRIAIASYDGTVELWGITQGEIFTPAASRIGSSPPGIDHALFTPSGDHVVTASSDGTVAVFDRRTRERGAMLNADFSQKALTASFGHNQLHLAIAPHGMRLLAFAPGGEGVDLWDLPTGDGHARIRRNGVLIARFVRDGALVATTCLSGEAELWNARTGDRVQGFKHGEFVEAAALSPDGRHLATAGNDIVKLWDLSGADPQPRELRHVDVERVAFSADSQQLLSEGDGETTLWRIADIPRTADPWNSPRPLNVVRAVYRAHGNPKGVGDSARAMAFLPQGPRVLTAAYDARVRLWDVGSNRLQARFESPFVQTNDAAFSRDGKLIVTANGDGIARMWDVDGHLLASYGGHTGSVAAAALSSDGNLVITAGDDGTARIYSVTLQGLLEVACERIRHDLAADKPRCRRAGK
jgi:WD40 repeat protein